MHKRLWPLSEAFVERCAKSSSKVRWVMVPDGTIICKILFSINVWLLRLRLRWHECGLCVAEVGAVIDRFVDHWLVPALHKYRYMPHVGMLFAMWLLLVVLSAHFETLVWRGATVWGS